MPSWPEYDTCSICSAIISGSGRAAPGVAGINREAGKVVLCLVIYTTRKVDS
jgi:hypothetical protein